MGSADDGRGALSRRRSAVLACVAHPWRSVRGVGLGARRGSGHRGEEAVEARGVVRCALEGSRDGRGRSGVDGEVRVVFAPACEGLADTDRSGSADGEYVTTKRPGPAFRDRILAPGRLVSLYGVQNDPDLRPDANHPAPGRRRTTNPRPEAPATAHSLGAPEPRNAPGPRCALSAVGAPRKPALWMTEQQRATARPAQARRAALRPGSRPRT